MNLIWNSKNKPIRILSRPKDIIIDRSQDSPIASVIAEYYEKVGLDNGINFSLIQNNVSIFDGIADYTSFTYDKENIVCIKGRETVGLLLDSEAFPSTYEIPSLYSLENNCTKPYGIKIICDDNIKHRLFSCPYSIQKGTSEWCAVKNFCNNYLQCGIFAVGDKIYIGNPPAKTVNINNPVISFTESVDIYKYISDSYNLINNEWKHFQNDSRVNNINLVRNRFYTKSNNNIIDKNSYCKTLNVVFDGYINCMPNQTANFRYIKGTMKICSVRQELNYEGWKTTLILRKDDM